MKRSTMSRTDAIVEIALTMPPGSDVKEITRRAMAARLWPVESDAACIFKARHSEVRRTLNRVDDDGLPVGFIEEREEEVTGIEMERDEDGEIESVRMTTQGYFWGRDFFTVDLAKKCISQHVKGINERGGKLDKWISYFEERWPNEPWREIARNQLELPI